MNFNFRLKQKISDAVGILPEVISDFKTQDPDSVLVSGLEK